MVINKSAKIEIGEDNHDQADVALNPIVMMKYLKHTADELFLSFIYRNRNKYQQILQAMMLSLVKNGR